jgi:hypothetical protein
MRSQILFSIFFLILTWSNFARADHLTLYAYKAPLGIDWSSPQSLTWSTLLNDLVESVELRAIHSIGHLNFHLKCDPTAEEPRGIDFEIGQTNSDNRQMRERILKDEYGLGTMTSDYSGRWEDSADIEHDLAIRYRLGQVRFLDFKIRSSTCQRIVSYLREYKARGLDQIYGGLDRQARQGHGAGCASFATSVLEVAGLMNLDLKKFWTRQIRVPLRLIGGPRTGRRVSLSKLLFDPVATQWGQDDSSSYTFEFWDPARVYDWVKLAHRKIMPFNGFKYTRVRRENALGVAIDVTSLETPTEPFWQN